MIMILLNIYSILYEYNVLYCTILHFDVLNYIIYPIIIYHVIISYDCIITMSSAQYPTKPLSTYKVVINLFLRHRYAVLVSPKTLLNTFISYSWSCSYHIPYTYSSLLLRVIHNPMPIRHLLCKQNGCCRKKWLLPNAQKYTNPINIT